MFCVLTKHHPATTTLRPARDGGGVSVLDRGPRWLEDGCGSTETTFWLPVSALHLRDVNILYRYWIVRRDPERCLVKKCLVKNQNAEPRRVSTLAEEMEKGNENLPATIYYDITYYGYTDVRNVPIYIYIYNNKTTLCPIHYIIIMWSSVADGIL